MFIYHCLSNISCICMFKSNMLQELKKTYEKSPDVELYDLLDQLHSCKYGDGKPVSDYVLMMKGFFDKLHRLDFGYPVKVQVNLINRSLNKYFRGFVPNFNMHCSGKTLRITRNAGRL